MVLGRCSGNGPSLAKPFRIFLSPDSAPFPLLLSRPPISTRLSLHQNEFDVILYYCIWLVWFSEKLGAPVHLVIRIRYLVPDYWVQIENGVRLDIWVFVRGSGKVWDDFEAAWHVRMKRRTARLTVENAEHTKKKNVFPLETARKGLSLRSWEIRETGHLFLHGPLTRPPGAFPCPSPGRSAS